METNEPSRASRSEAPEQARKYKMNIRKILLDYQYIEAVVNHDIAHHNDQSIQYFSLVGMDDADIAHSLMSVKEMIYSGYQLNGYKDDIANNAGVLSGSRPYIVENGWQKFHVPKFQPRALARVPQVERYKLMYPINIADFLFPDGVQVISANEVLRLRQSSADSGPNLKQYPFLSHYGTSMLECNAIQNEKVFTNQEGKLYYVTSLNYFVDLADIEAEFLIRGHYRNYRANNLDETTDEAAKVTNEIATRPVPQGRYYLPFTMCFISLKSYKQQFFKLLNSLYSAYVNNAMARFPTPGQLTFEQNLNRIVFGIPFPPKKKFDYMSDYLPSLQGWQQKPVVEVQLYAGDEKDKIYFQNENNFDLPNSNFENIWVLIQTLSAENVLQLFKRLLFSTCNILVSEDAKTLNQCIQGIIDLFYPLTCDLVCVPNLPESMLEYVNMCGQCVIGVVQQSKGKDEEKKSKEGEREESGQAKVRVNEEAVDLFDIMQDNSCQIDLKKNYSIQKPKQVVGFNAKGKLAQGQSAAKVGNSGKNFTHQSTNQMLMQTQQGTAKQSGVSENLNDIELPRDSSKSIKSAIQKAQREQKKLTSALTDKMRELKNLQKDPTASKDPAKEEKLKNEIHHCQCQMQQRVYEVRIEFYKMIRSVIVSYTTPNLLMEFKRAKKESRHMTNFMRWQNHRDIFQLIKRKEFKHEAKSAEDIPLYKQQFYQRLIYYPLLQNFIIEKFFPSNIDQNIRQLHGIKELDLLGGSQARQHDLTKSGKANIDAIAKAQELQYKDERQKQKVKPLYPEHYKAAITQNTARKTTFLRAINEEHLRQDFLQSYQHFADKQNRELSRQDSQFAEILKSPGEESESLAITNVVETRYRMTIYYEQLTPKINIIIAWLLLFIGSLDYQLNPSLFSEKSRHEREKKLSYQSYRCPKYFEAQSKLEQLLARYFEKVLKILIYKNNYEFNQKCPLLTMLFQYTHKYNFLHQKLIDVVHQDIDQQQAGVGNGGSMAVSNSFMIFQLHWDNKQMKFTKKEEKKLRDQRRLDAYKQALEQKLNREPELRAKLNDAVGTRNGKGVLIPGNFLEKALENKDPSKFNALMKEHEVDISPRWDPVVLNDSIEPEWKFNKVRYEYLKELSKYDDELNEKNIEKRARAVRAEKKKLQSGHNQQENVNKGKGLGSKIKKGFKGLFSGGKNIDDKVKISDINQGSIILDQHDHHENGDDPFHSLPERKAELSRELNDGKILHPQLDYEEQVLQCRSFVSLNQLKNSKKVMVSSAHSQNNQQVSPNSKIEDRVLNPRIELDIVPDNVNQNSSVVEDFLNLNKDKKKGEDKIKSEILVRFASELGTYEITKVKSMQPKALRSGVESVLRICKNYKTAQSIDLSAFSQIEQEQELYWNLVFWFKHQSLPYLWMAPFLQHLGGREGASSNQASNEQNSNINSKDPQPSHYFSNPVDMWHEHFTAAEKEDSFMMKRMEQVFKQEIIQQVGGGKGKKSFEGMQHTEEEKYDIALAQKQEMRRKRKNARGGRKLRHSEILPGGSSLIEGGRDSQSKGKRLNSKGEPVFNIKKALMKSVALDMINEDPDKQEEEQVDIQVEIDDHFADFQGPGEHLQFIEERTGQEFEDKDQIQSK